MHLMDFPAAVFVVSFGSLWIASFAGVYLRRQLGAIDKEEREDFNIVLTATLTLLGLIVGFTFSMAVSRYDLRKHCEEEEANSIGTEYLRADFLPATDTPKIRALLMEYLQLRLVFYTMSGYAHGSARRLDEIDVHTTQLQGKMWSLLHGSSASQGTATVALAAAGMNDVVNSEGYAQGAWRNRVPRAAWILMCMIAICCNFLMGFGTVYVRPVLLLVLPTILSVAFFLIADIDSPRDGVIRIHPENLLSLSASLNAH